MKHETASVDQRLAEISRGLFINRCLLIFVAVCLTILLFLPRLAATIVGAGDAILNACAPYADGTVSILVSLAALILCAGYVVSKLAPAAPASQDKAE